MRGGQLKHKVKIEWSNNFAYAIGLLTSDGNLAGDERHIGFASVDMELIEKFKHALSLTNRVSHSRRGGGLEKKYLQIRFGDKIFFKYLNDIGLTTKKSKTIKSVDVPAAFFADFVRGVFDGDGSFYTFWDTRWPNSFGYQISIASASRDFLLWLKNKLTILYHVKGFIRRGDGVFEIRYAKGDTRRLATAMYHRPNLLFLSRKYHKIKSAFAFDENLHPDRKEIYAAVAQW